jgi:adenosylhomocysteine nucleosidase
MLADWTRKGKTRRYSANAHDRAILLLSGGPLKSRRHDTGTSPLILLFYAFARELAPFKRRLESRRAIGDAHLRGFRAQLGATEIVGVTTGIGFARTEIAARHAFDLFPDAEFVLGTGVAGALSSGLDAGDLIVPDQILSSRAEGSNAEQVAAIDEAILRELGRCLRAEGISYSTGALLTSHRVLGTGADKRAIQQESGAIAVDMETAALALEARARSVRFAVVRAVMDSVDDEVVGAEMADESGNIRPLRAANFLLRNPGVVTHLPRMMQSLNHATRSLAAALEAIVTHHSKPAGHAHRESP